MEKQKRWQLFLILAVIILTVYNILPTLFYYAQPLKKPIDQKDAQKISTQIVSRVNSLEDFTLSWLKAQSKNLGLKPEKIALDSEDPRIASVKFKTEEDALFFSKVLFRAGALIPFAPAQLSPDARSFESSNTAYVQRKIGIHLDPTQINTYFHFAEKFDGNNQLTPEYRSLINDRVAQVAIAIGGQTEEAKTLIAIQKAPLNDKNQDDVIRLARKIVEFENTFGDQSPIANRFYASFTQTSQPNRSELVSQFVARLERLNTSLSSQLDSLKKEQESLREKDQFLNSNQLQMLEVLDNQKNIAQAATLIVKRNSKAFEAGSSPLVLAEVLKDLNNSSITANKSQELAINGLNPFISKILVNWDKDTISLILHDDVNRLRLKEVVTETQAFTSDKLNQLLFNEIAMVARTTDENIKPSVETFSIALNTLTNSKSFLALDLGAIAKEQAHTLQSLIKSSWNRVNSTSNDLSESSYPIVEYNTYKTLPAQDKKLGLYVYTPSMDEEATAEFKPGSLYVVAKGLNSLQDKYKELPDSSQKKSFDENLKSLQELLRQNGFISYPGSYLGENSTFKNDTIFELDDYYSYLLAATREDFSVHGSKRYAVLEFTDVEQRLLTLNKIDTRIHEDLLKWRDEYNAAKVNLNLASRYDVPAPTKNVVWDNIQLSAIKYFRGDNRKILRWGLDLSGGKTVRIGLKDQNNQPITDEADLRQAVNELYNRVNKMGVSEVGTRIEGSTIVLDFPGSQGLTAADLIQASAMYFHVVNEKFTTLNPNLAESVNTFLDEVWNEAVITNRRDMDSLNEIAWHHLGGSLENPEEFHPKTSHAKLLYDNGLRFAGPNAPARSNNFDDALSSIALYRGNDFSEWQGQTYPLLIVFRNYALEGANLVNVNTGYDPSEGNILYFNVKSSYSTRDGQKINPRDDFYAWTSQFSEEKIAGTPRENFSQGKGWRMAVILNGTIVNAPTLNAALRDSAKISGHFSQREVNQLAADLRAGSLSFTPHILSEENISPDLGIDQRNQGIFAAFVGLVLVIIAMVAYYRFGGIVASVAVLFNLLIMWGVLQNLDAALTLPGIAGIILTVGMAVDANVLVFERIREEFALSGRLPSAIQAGYKKAFTAIIDSNLTTIIAALILLNFDSGPIKGFAVTLIIGIVSSMFTSLFMTRYFFAGWVQNPKHKSLKMSRFFGQTNFNFLSKAKIAIIVTGVVLVAGGFLLVKNKETIFGMDFTGGYALTVDLKEKVDSTGKEIDYKAQVASALEKAGAHSSDFQIRQLNKPNNLRIQFGMGMEQPGKPFYQIDDKTSAEDRVYKFQEYPRIVWIVKALDQANLDLTPNSLVNLDLHWTQMSGQLSDSMRNNALIGLGLALLCILVYITFRFEFKYAISATIGLAHDVLVSVAVLAILHIFFEGIQIDLQVIAALMTIIGYSLNDTIIIFDRIREESRTLRKWKFSDIVNHALNATLSRTVMTSGTTLLVLLALVTIGGGSIFNFALVMTIGVGIGTLSSLYVAAPVLLYFHNREIASNRDEAALKKV